MFNKRKWLTRLNQKVMEMGRAAICSALVIRKSPGQEQAPNPMNSNRRNVETPYVSQRCASTVEWASRKADRSMCGLEMSEEAKAVL